MDLGLIEKRALVAGGSDGVGAAVAKSLAAEGARVAVAARASDRLSGIATEIGAEAIAVDLSTADGPAAAVAAAAEALGGLDLLLVNSGGPPPGRFEDLSEDDWQRAIDGTLWSTIRLIREALPHLRASDAPAIVVILSSSVREPIQALMTSNVLRPGLAGMIKALVGEIAPIRINGIAPGRVATARIARLDGRRADEAGVTVAEIERQTIARIPLGRYGDPAEVGRLGAFLLSPAASYIHGAIVPVDGGMVKALP
ncbi:MAG TPA: SDR family oxidoreductase [Candidatus Limnocylindria bacterium]|nr:SDR family oxidoreductase [Candidatus Limnocylindria bacterium]